MWTGQAYEIVPAVDGWTNHYIVMDERLHGIAIMCERQRWHIGAHEADPLVALTKKVIERVMHPYSEIVALLVEKRDSMAGFHDAKKHMAARWGAGKKAIKRQV